jgi:Tfp pilus assembly protein PilX
LNQQTLNPYPDQARKIQAAAAAIRGFALILENENIYPKNNGNNCFPNKEA